MTKIYYVYDIYDKTSDFVSCSLDDAMIYYKKLRLNKNCHHRLLFKRCFEYFSNGDKAELIDEECLMSDERSYSIGGVKS